LREAAAAARRLVRLALKGTLATIDRASGHPFASLVLVATEPDGAPLLLLSRLAVHTQNLENDARASLLIDGTSELADPLTGGRVTLVGKVRPAATATAKPRFLARHPTAAGYAEFPDFGAYALDIESGHYIGGFGRIVGLQRPELLTDIADAAALAAAEADIIAHMNADHADAVVLYATQLAGCTAGDWRMSGIDPDGFDLLHRNKAARVDFPHRVCTPEEARTALVRLVQEARAAASATTCG
jgi:putative heme iron utilization protein